MENVKTSQVAGLYRKDLLLRHLCDSFRSGCLLVMRDIEEQFQRTPAGSEIPAACRFFDPSLASQMRHRHFYQMQVELAGTHRYIEPPGASDERHRDRSCRVVRPDREGHVRQFCRKGSVKNRRRSSWSPPATRRYCAYGPNLISNPNDGPHTAQECFNTAAFVLPAQDTFGDAGRNVVTGPGLAGLDLSLQKEEALHDRARIQLRFDPYNSLNHPNFNLPW